MDNETLFFTPIGENFQQILTVKDFKNDVRLKDDLVENVKVLKAQADKIQSIVTNLHWSDIFTSGMFPSKLDDVIEKMHRASNALGKSQIELLVSVSPNMSEIWLYLFDLVPENDIEHVLAFQSSTNGLFQSLQKSYEAGRMASIAILDTVLNIFVTLRSEIFNAVNIGMHFYFMLWTHTVQRDDDEELQIASVEDGLLLISLTTRLINFSDMEIENAEKKLMTHISEIASLFANKLHRYHSLLSETAVNYEAIIDNDPVIEQFVKLYWHTKTPPLSVFDNIRSLLPFMATCLKLSPTVAMVWLTNLTPHRKTLFQPFAEYFQNVGKFFGENSSSENSFSQVLIAAENMAKTFDIDDDDIKLGGYLKDSLTTFIENQIGTKEYEVVLVDKGTHLLASLFLHKDVDSQVLENWYKQYLGVDNVEQFINDTYSVTKYLEYAMLTAIPFDQLQTTSIDNGIDEELEELKEKEQIISEQLDQLRRKIGVLMRVRNFTGTNEELIVVSEDFSRTIRNVLESSEGEITLNNKDIQKVLYRATRKINYIPIDKELRKTFIEYSVTILRGEELLKRRADLLKEKAKQMNIDDVYWYVRGGTLAVLLMGAAGYLYYSDPNMPSYADIVQAIQDRQGFWGGMRTIGQAAANGVLRFTGLKGISFSELSLPNLISLVTAFTMGGSAVKWAAGSEILANWSALTVGAKIALTSTELIWEGFNLATVTLLVPAFSRGRVSVKEAFTYQKIKTTNKVVTVFSDAVSEVQSVMPLMRRHMLAVGQAVGTLSVAAWTGGFTGVLGALPGQVKAIDEAQHAPFLPSKQQFLEYEQTRNNPVSVVTVFKKEKGEYHQHLKQQIDNYNNNNNQEIVVREEKEEKEEEEEEFNFPMLEYKVEEAE